MTKLEKGYVRAFLQRILFLIEQLSKEGSCPPEEIAKIRSDLNHWFDVHIKTFLA